MNYDLISSLRVEELKTYLKERGLKTSGRRVELVARVFAASENNVPVVKSAVEIEADLKQEYTKKLDIDGYGIPDPFSRGRRREISMANGFIDGYIFIPHVPSK